MFEFVDRSPFLTTTTKRFPSGEEFATFPVAGTPLKYEGSASLVKAMASPTQTALFSCARPKGQIIPSVRMKASIRNAGLLIVIE